jgi:intein/homing endonuclease
LLFKEFGYESKVTKHGKINIGKLSIIQRIISYTILGHLKWKVPSLIMNSTKRSQIAFIRGYFDGDGTASGRIRFFSTNELGLKQVSELLKKLKIKHTTQDPVLKEKRKPLYIIQISEKEKERFLNLIQPVSKIPGQCGGKY